ncbi:helix-turn-helix domain-containing protein [Arthrobacter sp. ISL-28]|uniref:IclR family transcriptional regulator domain-containing protein n=1 Tax=Arthrobacter sp. ISL-28 TaxID=2819108 RepID=UPI001BEC85E3|nr:helix-turn-helix domain-containing protein [Arthrobacter sp. ISL-28]MBT2520148.1 helix-turn-helix domain-containing protein [Arthrobacter sp. ISL-28]
MTKLGSKDEIRRAQRTVEGANPADYSEALERGLSVLKVFKHPDERLTQADIARSLDLPRATVRRAIMTLVHLGYATPDGRAYRLTPHVLTLATAYLGANPISHVLQPACEEICHELSASCTVAVLDNNDAVMVARAVPRNPMGVGHGVGFRVPAAHSALGYVLLSAESADRRTEVLTSGVAPLQETALDRALSAIADVDLLGFAYVANDVEPGFHSIAVPLRRWDGTVVAAINVGTNIEHLDADVLQGPVFQRLIETAQRLQPQLI